MEGNLNQAFETAQQRVKQLAKRPSNEHLLALYGLYKQAVSGDATGKAPSRFKVAEHAKFNAWKQLAGTVGSDCQRRYVELVDELFKKQG